MSSRPTIDRPLILPVGFRKLNSYKFKDCEFDTGIIIPDTINDLRPYCFLNATINGNLVLPNTISELTYYCLKGITFKNGGQIVIPNSVKVLNTPFWDIKGLSFIFIPNSVNSLSHNVFNKDFFSVKNIYIDNPNIEFKCTTFLRCDYLDKVYAPDHVIKELGGRFASYERMADIPKDYWFRRELFWSIDIHHFHLTLSEKEFVMVLHLIENRLECLLPELLPVILSFISFGDFNPIEK